MAWVATRVHTPNAVSGEPSMMPRCSRIRPGAITAQCGGNTKTLAEPPAAEQGSSPALEGAGPLHVPRGRTIDRRSIPARAGRNNSRCQ